MDEFMKAQLRKDEEILWTGTPHDVKLFEKSCKQGLLIRWIICSLFIVLAAVYSVYAMNMQFETTNIVIVCSITLLCAGASAFSPLMVQKGLEKNYTYYITNQRVIAYKAGVSPRMDWREMSDVNKVLIDMIDETHGNIYLGEKNKAAIASLRTDIRSRYSEEHKNTTLVFCSVENAADVYDLFPRGIKVDRIKQDGQKSA